MLRTWRGRRRGARSSRNPTGCGACRSTGGCRRAGAPHRLRHLLPRGADRRLGRAGARARAPAAARRTRSSSSATRATRSSRSRPRARSKGRSGSSPASPTARSGSSPTRCVVATPGGRDELVPHGELHLRRRDDRRAARGGRRAACRRSSSARSKHREPVSSHERFLVAGAGRDWPTAQEAVLKLREGACVAAEAHTPSSSCTATWPRSTSPCGPSCSRARAGRPSARPARSRRCASSAARRRWCRRVHPVVDVVRFQLLTLDLAEARGIDPDPIRRDDPRWERAARGAYEWSQLRRRAARLRARASGRRPRPCARGRACRAPSPRAGGTSARPRRARETSASCIAAESGSEIQSGSSIHSPTSCSFSTSAGTQSKVASLPLTSRQVSSISRQLRPGCVAL